MKITLDWIATQTIATDRLDREIKLNCPNCDDNTQHLYINMKKLVWYCFKCGRGGKVEDKAEANLENFAKLTHKGQPLNLETMDKLRVKSLPINRALPYIEIAEDCESGEELTARQYLNRRGITQAEIVKYGICLSLEKSGPYKNSVIFPVYGKYDDLTYFVCRKYDGSKPKYSNAPWPKGDTLFIADANKGGPNYPWVICEGIFDALAVCRVGYNAIALLGKVPTSQQLKRLSSNDRYLIYLDDDAFSHAINLKLQLNAIGTKAQLVVHNVDAAQLYVDNTPLLRSLLDGATKQLNEHKK